MSGHGEEIGARVLERLRRYVEMESPSGDEAAIAALAREVGAELSAAGAEVEVRPAPGAGANLLARVAGEDPAAAPVVVLGHLDTVWPVGTLARLPFRVEGGEAYGPGAYDMKAGVAVLVEVLRGMRADGVRPRRRVEALLTCDEEVGSESSRAWIEETARNAAAVLVLEPPIAGGAAKTARKGVIEYRLVVHGRAAHAGLEPEKGVSAIAELALQIPRALALADPAQGTTLNVGRIGGGTAINVVAAEAWADLEARYWSAAESDRVRRGLRALAPVLAGARLELVEEDEGRPAFERTEAVLALYEKARLAARELGVELGEGAVGGGSDGNWTAAIGVPTLDGLGVDGAGAHAEHEHIRIDDVPFRAALLRRLLETL